MVMGKVLLVYPLHRNGEVKGLHSCSAKVEAIADRGNADAEHYLVQQEWFWL